MSCYVVYKLFKNIPELLLKITEKRAWLSAASVKQQVAVPRSAFLVFPPNNATIFTSCMQKHKMTYTYGVVCRCPS